MGTLELKGKADTGYLSDTQSVVSSIEADMNSAFDAFEATGDDHGMTKGAVVPTRQLAKLAASRSETCLYETRLHSAGCNLLNHTCNKLPSYRTSSWMKKSYQQNSAAQHPHNIQHIIHHIVPREKIDRRRHRTHNLGIKIPFLPHLCLGGHFCVGAS